MLISAFTFLKNANILGYPFVQSIKSVLPLVDEMVINVGKSEDDTLEIVENLALLHPKIKIIKSTWCENMNTKGYVYGQQKMIAQFNAQGKYAFYLEADEVLHENDLEIIISACKKYENNDNVEAIAFKYLHFYGNSSTTMDGSSWYRKEARIIKTSVRSYAPDGLFWCVLDKSNKKSRYPKAVLIDATIYHYGWLRSEESMSKKSQYVSKYWKHKSNICDYSKVDKRLFRLFSGNHPSVMSNYLVPSSGLFETDSTYRPTAKENRQILLRKIERLFNLDFSKKHYIPIKIDP